MSRFQKQTPIDSHKLKRYVNRIPALIFEIMKRELTELLSQSHQEGTDSWNVTGADSTGNIFRFVSLPEETVAVIQPPKETPTSFQYYIVISDNGTPKIEVVRHYTHSSYCGDPRGPVSPVEQQTIQRLAAGGNALWQNTGKLLDGTATFSPMAAMVGLGSENFDINSCFQPTQ